MSLSEIRTKRARSLSSTSSSSSGCSDASLDLHPPYPLHTSPNDAESTSKSGSSHHPAKMHRQASNPNTGGYVCCLPPTCHTYGSAATFSSAEEMERHQGMYHRFVCRVGVRDKGQFGYARGYGPRGPVERVVLGVDVGSGSSASATGVLGAECIGGSTIGSGSTADGPIDETDIGMLDDPSATENDLPTSSPSVVSSTRNDRQGSRDMRDGKDLPQSFVSGAFANGRGKGRWKECGKVFPDERFLTLHHTETHDPIARGKQNEGEKIFECFIPKPECGKRFRTPAKRRMHLVAKHKYPPDFFFAITNHGLNTITEKEGLAASLIRPRRPHNPTSQATPSTSAYSPHPASRTGDVLAATARHGAVAEDADMAEPPSRSLPSEHDIGTESHTTKDGASVSEPAIDGKGGSDGVDQLANALESSLAFVPRNVRRSARLQQQRLAGEGVVKGVGSGQAGEDADMGT